MVESKIVINLDLNGRLESETFRDGMIKIELLAKFSNQLNNTGPRINFQFLLVQNYIRKK